jgi:hypothetical protein
LNRIIDGQSKATTKQVEYAFATRQLEDHRTRHVDMPAVQETATASLRVRQLRLLRRTSSDRPKGRGSGRIEFEDGAGLIASRWTGTV